MNAEKNNDRFHEIIKGAQKVNDRLHEIIKEYDREDIGLEFDPFCLGGPAILQRGGGFAHEVTTLEELNAMIEQLTFIKMAISEDPEAAKIMNA